MFAKILKNKTENFYIQFLRFAITGIIGFVVDFGVLYALTEFCGWHYLLSATLGFVCGLIATYFLSVFWVFDKRRFNNAFSEFALFAVISGIGLLLNLFLMWFCTEIIDFHYLISKIISSVLVMFWNFFARKYILFSKK
ncbi:MAG: GtrA family protein [Prevotellaceae bacterium]|jgi:putative flippase GtrA|nr:GtrA family protein [Prevotellaceae bacterium]